MDHVGRSLPAAGFDEYERILALVDQRRFDEALMRGRVMLEDPEIVRLVRAKTHNLLCWLLVEALRQPTPEAVLHGEEAAHIAMDLGDQELELQALLNQATALFHLGAYDAAEETYTRAQEMLQAAPALLNYGPTLVLLGLADIARVRGDLQRALHLLDEAQAISKSDESRALLAELFRRKALLLLRLDRPEEAAKELRRVNRPSLTAGRRGLWWRTHLGLTQALLETARGRKTRARKLSVATLALAQELGDKPSLAEAMSILALLDAADGRPGAARRAQEALSRAIESGRRDVVASVRTRVASLLAGDI